MDEATSLACAAAIPVTTGLPVVAEAILELEGGAAKKLLECKLSK